MSESISQGLFCFVGFGWGGKWDLLNKQERLTKCLITV